MLQHGIIVVASNIFYGFWNPRFLILIWISTISSWGLAFIAASAEKRHGKMALWACVSLNLFILFIFKYYSFFSDSIRLLLQQFNLNFEPWFFEVILPVGISFYTFQVISYIVDVYNKKITPCRSLLVFAQFVMFFPQLVAGPIERANRLIPQLERGKIVTLENLSVGIGLIAIGFFKKCFVADMLGLYVVDPIFSYPGSPVELILAVCSFAMQIYCDFSGYCDIAIGSALCMNISLHRNFNAPYHSFSIQEFWKRWHITLSEWFRDYVYIPLGGSRKGVVRGGFALMGTMLLCGLWHGASSIYILWGGYHGAAILLHRLFRPLLHKTSVSNSKLYARISWLATFIIVLYGWMIFRSPSLKYFIMYNKTLFTGFRQSGLEATFELFFLVSWMSLIVALLHKHQENGYNYKVHENNIVNRRPYSFAVLCGVLFTVSVLFGNFNESTQFIYFQF